MGSKVCHPHSYTTLEKIGILRKTVDKMKHCEDKNQLINLIEDAEMFLIALETDIEMENERERE